MPAPAAPFIEMLSLASAGFGEGQAALTDAQGLGGEAARPLLAFGNQVIASAFAQVEAAAKRYLQTTECLNHAAPRVIQGDAAFQVAVMDCAEKLDAAAPLLSVAGQRVPPVLRRWLGNPSEARRLAMQCDAAGRLAKTRAGRAA